jgi:hypothetical protein
LCYNHEIVFHTHIQLKRRLKTFGVIVAAGVLLGGLLRALPDDAASMARAAVGAVFALEGFLPLSVAVAFLLPGPAEAVITVIFTIVFTLLFFQFVSRVYAMAYTLYWTSTESKDTTGLIAMDIDNDGYIDHVAFNKDSDGSYSHDVYLNDGDGTFTYDTSIGSSFGFETAVAGDVDRDGDPDIIASVYGGEYIQLYTNNYDGISGFTSNDIASGLSIQAKKLALADVDNDGDLDLVAGGNVHTLGLYLNNGAGSFTSVVSPLPAFDSIAHADFDSDGDIDLALALNDISYSLFIYKNSGTGAFSLLSSITDGSTYPRREISTADMDGDGDIDIVMSTQASGPSGLQYIHLNDGFGGFTSFESDVVGSHVDARGAGLGDLDNDGDVDIITAGLDDTSSDGGHEIWLNNGPATNFTQNGSTLDLSACSYDVAVADIDNDGDLDFLSGDAGCGSGFGAGADTNNAYRSDQSATSANMSPTAPSASSMTGSLVPPAPKSGASFASNNAIGTSNWNSTSNAATSNDTSTNTSSMSVGTISEYLVATDFRFSVPTSATINGIKVEVEKKASGTLTASDYAVRIVKGGTIQSTDLSSDIAWPFSDAYTTYGGASELWGTTWTPANINASNFGFAIACEGVTGAGGCMIDHIRITVYYSMRDIRLSWGSGADTFTPARQLQYQIKVGTTSGDDNIVPASTASPNWAPRVMPNGQSRMYLLRNLACNQTYYWSAASIDGGFRRSWSTEKTFTLSSSCVFSADGGGSSPPPPPPAGGGLPWSFRNQQKPDTGAGVSNGVLTVTAFRDANADGIKQSGEVTGFRGLPVTASGSSTDGTPVRKTLALGDRGTAIFDLPPSDGRGYHVLYDTGALVLDGHELSVERSQTGSLLKSGGTAEVYLPFRRDDLLRYRPCLSIASSGGIGLSEADTLLRRLKDPFGNDTVSGLNLTGSLVSRRTFFTLLQRTQCIDLLTAQDALANAFRTSGKQVLLDLPLSAAVADAVIAYSLMAKDVAVGRGTRLGPAADFQSPVTRREAVAAVFSALAVPEDAVIGTGSSLPLDLAADDPLVPAFFTLQSLGILPESFGRIFGPNQGLTGAEASLILARASFRAGKIPLVHPVFDQPKKDTTKPAAPPATFLASLPSLEPLTCLERVPERSQTISFSDVLPGESIETDMRELLTRGFRNGDKKMLWLITATRRPTEFGVEKGQGRLNASEPVSLLETLRSLLVLSCLTFEENSGVRTEGSGESRIPRDRISDLKRDSSLASRILYRAQDREKEFDQSLLSYAQPFLHLPVRSPADPLTLGEASDVLASALLRILVKQQKLTPQQAEAAATDLAAGIAKDLLGKDLDWRDEAILRNTPFSRQMLVQFLITVIRNRTSAVSTNQPSAQSLPLGEVWWQRVK